MATLFELDYLIVAMNKVLTSHLIESYVRFLRPLILSTVDK